MAPVYGTWFSHWKFLKLSPTPNGKYIYTYPTLSNAQMGIEFSGLKN